MSIAFGLGDEVEVISFDARSNLVLPQKYKPWPGVFKIESIKKIYKKANMDNAGVVWRINGALPEPGLATRLHKKGLTGLG